MSESIIKQIASLKVQMSKVLDSGKTELAKALDDVCKQYKELVDAGAPKDFLREPQFQEYREILGISFEDGKPATTSTTAKGRAKKGALRDAILSVLGSGHAMTHATLKDALGKKMGRPVSNQFNLLDKLVKQKDLTKSGSGKSATYSVKK